MVAQARTKASLPGKLMRSWLLLASLWVAVGGGFVGCYKTTPAPGPARLPLKAEPAQIMNSQPTQAQAPAKSKPPKEPPAAPLSIEATNSSTERPKTATGDLAGLANNLTQPESQ